MVLRGSAPAKWVQEGSPRKEKIYEPEEVVGATSAWEAPSSLKAEAAQSSTEIWGEEDEDKDDEEGMQQLNLDDMKKAWSQEARDFEANFGTLAEKIQRFPRSLNGLKSYITPKAVSIGPYHRDVARLQDMQKVKKVAADHFIKKSGRPFKAIYKAVTKAAGAASDFYAINDVRGMDNNEFANMMFLDGCFLLQFMVMCTGSGRLHPALLSFFDTNQAAITKDIMLLENQLPWVVLRTLRKFVEVPVEEFAAKMGRTLQVRKDMEEKPFVLDGSYNPPHLLGLLWYYKTGSRTDEEFYTIPVRYGLKPMSKTVSAIELAEIGIRLRASKTAKFSDMGIKKVPLLTNIFLAPLLLDQVRSSWLVNMVAFEVGMSMATTGTGNLVVCSYIAILAMLMDREEDVHKLRADRIVQGELTNKEMLDFFKTVIKHTSGGDPYIRIMEEVEDYKLKWWVWIILYQFFYKNWKTITAVLSIIPVVVGILKLAIK